MIDYSSSAVLTAFAILVVAAAMTPRTNTKPTWRGFVIATAIASSGLGTAIFSLSQGGSPLIRDVVAIIVVALLAPGLTAALGVRLHSAPAVARFFGALVAGLVFLIASPLLLLVAHCTSGDCL